MKNNTDIPFKDRFKPGDIICSDYFYNGKCMVVEEFSVFQWKSGKTDEQYTCVDLLNDDEKFPQKWLASDKDTFGNKEYHWRIATDEDIVKYLLTEFMPLSHECGGKVFCITENKVKISGDYIDTLTLSLEEAVELRDKLNEWIIKE